MMRRLHAIWRRLFAGPWVSDDPWYGAADIRLDQLAQEAREARRADQAVCDECGKDYDHRGHCDICGIAIFSTWQQHDAVFGHERETDREAEERYERRFER